MRRGIPRKVVEYFKNIPLFSEVSAKGLRSVIMAATEIEEPAGAVLVREGDTGREMFVIVDGRVRVSRKGRRLADMGPGDFFGELAFLSHAERTATVTATSDVRLLVLGPRELEVIVDEEPTVAVRMLAAVASRLREVERRPTA